MESAHYRREELLHMAATYGNVVLVAGLLAVGIHESVDTDDGAHNKSIAQCATDISPAEYEQTQALLEQPDSKDVAKARKLSNVDRMTAAVRSIVVQKNSLTLVDPSTYLAPLKKDAVQGYQLPLSAYSKTAADFLADNGLGFKDSDADRYVGAFSSETRDLNAKERGSEVVKQEVINIIEEVSETPREYFAFAGVKRFVIAHQEDTYASWHRQSGTITINATLRNASDNTKHEIFHGAWYYLCGASRGGMHDQDIEPHNLHEYGTVPQKFTSEAIDEKYMELKPLYEKGEITAAEANEKIDAVRPNVCFTDAYGATNAHEDAAQIGRYFATPWAKKNVLDPRSPHLRAKAIVWLARIREQSPRVFAYFNGMIPPIDKEKLLR